MSHSQVKNQRVSSRENAYPNVKFLNITLQEPSYFMHCENYSTSPKTHLKASTSISNHTLLFIYPFDVENLSESTQSNNCSTLKAIFPSLQSFCPNRNISCRTEISDISTGEYDIAFSMLVR